MPTIICSGALSTLHLSMFMSANQSTISDLQFKTKWEHLGGSLMLDFKHEDSQVHINTTARIQLWNTGTTIWFGPRGAGVNQVK
ncbi:hypothetical protein ACS0TY_015646 [Phlomoides rotata]